MICARFLFLHPVSLHRTPASFQSFYGPGFLCLAFSIWFSFMSGCLLCLPAPLILQVPACLSSALTIHRFWTLYEPSIPLLNWLSSDEVVNLGFQFSCPVVFDKLHCSPEPTWSMALAQSVVLKLRVRLSVLIVQSFADFRIVSRLSFVRCTHSFYKHEEWMNPSWLVLLINALHSWFLASDLIHPRSLYSGSIWFLISLLVNVYAWIFAACSLNWADAWIHCRFSI